MTSEIAFLRLLHAVTEAANQASEIEEAARTCLEKVCDFTGWPLGHLCLLAGESPKELASTRIWHSVPPDAFQSFRRESEAIRWTAGQGLPGLVLESGSPVWVADFAAESTALRRASAAREGIRAACACPISAGGEVAGVLEFFSTVPAPRDALLVQVMAQLGTQLGRVVERDRADMALRQSEMRFRAVAQRASDAIVSIDAAGNTIFWNASAERIFGYRGEEMVGKPLTCLLPERYRAAHVAGLLRLSTTGESRLIGKTIEIQGLRSDGTEFPVELSLSTWKAGEERFYTGIIRDITERKRAAEALERRVEERTAEIRREKEFSERLIRSSGHGILAFDRECRCTVWNPGMERIYGLSEEEVLGQCVFDLFPFLQETGLDLCFREALEGRTVVVQDQPYSVPAAGRQGYFEGHYSPLYDERGEIIGGLSVVHDVTDRKLAEEALRKSEERYALAARGANDGLWDWDLVTNEIYFSPRWKAMLGYAEEEIGNGAEEWFARVSPEDRERLKAAIDAHRDGLTPHFQDEYRMRHKDGTYRWMLSRGVAVRDAGGRAVRMAGSQTDITARKVAEEQLQHDAFHDTLTGLPNRALFMDRLRGAVARSLRHTGRTYAVLFLDLDRFKFINDSLGHTVGDQLLVAIARRLEASLRPGDTVARLSGDEFAILLDEVRPRDASVVADRIQTDMAASFNLSGHEVFTSASIGIALGSPDLESAEDVLRDAHTAMYRAKALGKARHAVFATDMRERAVALLTLETDLRRALERREFRIHYQPIIAVETGRTVGFEALVRWQRSSGDLVPPAEFIPVAEETGLILPIGGWVLREACRQLRIWQTRLRGMPDLHIAVNLSVRQLTQSDVSGDVEQVLRETGLAPGDLGLEIIESAIMENTETANAILLRLKELGVHLHVDDFGMGYSSLSYLHRFSLDALKIDRSFIAKMNGDQENLEIVRTIVTLAHNLGLEVIAEGVETAEQLTYIKELACEFAQGYFFSRPLDAQAAGDWIARASGVSVWA